MRYPSRIDKYHNGKMVGFRTWYIEAYDENNNLIYKIDKKESNNYIKYVKFLIELRKLGWDLTLEQRKDIKSEPFMKEKYIKYVKKSHLIEVASLCGYDEQFIDDIKDGKRNETKAEFAYDMGLDNDELEKLIKYFS